MLKNEQRRLLEREYMRDTVELLESLRRRFGEKEVFDVVDKTVKERKLREWKKIAQNSKGNTLEDLVRALWPSKQRKRGYEFTIDRSEGKTQVLCTKCPVHEMARELGAVEWVNHLVCKGDPYIVEGFNPKLGFQHVKSLMEGQNCCQQLYFEKH
jgi:predicted ArsR family transcriptional regulator